MFLFNRVNKLSFDAAMRIFQLTKSFPKEERYSLVDQIRRSSRSVCANIGSPSVIEDILEIESGTILYKYYTGQAWRKRRYEAAFVSKLSDSEAEVYPVK